LWAARGRSGMTSWGHLHERARELTNGRDATRLANLALAAQVATRRGLLGRRRRLDGTGLADAVQALAVEPLHIEDRPNILLWSALADEAAAAGEGATLSMDAWVQSVQSADPARKTRGAYATPEQLAIPMAKSLLSQPSIPRRIIDPAAGAGGLLVAVLRQLRAMSATSSEIRGHVRRLYGVEIDPIARELACLAIWLAAGDSRITPASIGEQIVVDNAVTRDWWVDEPYDALIMNPPWDSLRHAPLPGETSAEVRRATVARLLVEAGGASGLPPLYSAQGRGDGNLYKAFVELAPHLLSERGRLTALLPGAWSSDLGTASLRRFYLTHLNLERWTSFENRRGYFPIDSRYKFGIMTGHRSSAGTTSFRTLGFAEDAMDLRRQHTRIGRHELRALGGASETVPDLTSTAERRLLMHYHRAGSPLFGGETPLGMAVYRREVDLTEDRKRGHFHRLSDLVVTPVGDGSWIDSSDKPLVPLVEGRMVGQYEFFAKSWVSGAGRTASWSWANGHGIAHCCPQFLAAPRSPEQVRIAICDVTSATNTRTVLATWVPRAWPCGNTAPVIVFESERQALAGLAVLNSMVFDWFARRLVAGLHLNRFYLETMRWPALTEGDIDQLASAASFLTSLSPRYRGVAEPRLTQRPAAVAYLDAHTLIEQTVAHGYGLDGDSLATVFSTSPEVRRGLWRHFVADPHAMSVVEAVTDAVPRRAKARPLPTR
jgi:N-6 DNA Methylase